jgi:hypothetical protein
MVPLTFGESAELFAALEPELPAMYFARQLRNLAQRGLLTPVGYRGSGRTAAALLDEEQICRARLLSVLARNGLQPEQLRRTIEYLGHTWHGGDGLVLSSIESDRGFPAYIDLIRKGERLFFVLKLGTSLSEKDENLGDLFGGFTRNPRFGPGEFRVLSTIVLDALDLLGPLLRQLDDIAIQERDPGPRTEPGQDDGSEAGKLKRSRRPLPIGNEDLVS